MDYINNIETFEFLATRWPRIRVIKALLALNELQPKQIAREQGINYSSLQMTTKGHRRHPLSMAAISRILGIPARELWDDNGSN